MQNVENPKKMYKAFSDWNITKVVDCILGVNGYKDLFHSDEKKLEIGNW